MRVVLRFALLLGFAVLLKAVEPVKPSAFAVGVCTHFSQGKGLLGANLGLMRQAGIGSLRDEVYWSGIEREKGRLETQVPVRSSWGERSRNRRCMKIIGERDPASKRRDSRSKRLGGWWGSRQPDVAGTFFPLYSTELRTAIDWTLQSIDACRISVRNSMTLSNTRCHSMI